MRIIAFSDNYNLATGYARDAYGLLTQLKRLGHDVAGIGLQHVGPPLEPVAGIPLYSGSTIPRAAQAIQHFQPDVVLHIRDNWWFVPRFQHYAYDLWPICEAARARLVAMTPLQSAPMPQELADTVAGRSDLTIVQAEAERDAFIAQGAPPDRIKVLPHGVDIDFFHPGTASRSDLQLPDHRPMLLTVASNTDRKNLPGNLLLLSKLRRNFPDAFLYLHSPGGGWYHLDLHTAALGLAGQQAVFTSPADSEIGITLHGTDDATLADLYRCADIFVSTTFSEGFGVPILEALASGTPALVTDTPILRELFGVFPHARFIPSRKEMPTQWGWDWFPDTDAGAAIAADLLHAGKPSTVTVPPRFLWPNIGRRLEGYLQELCPK